MRVTKNPLPSGLFPNLPHYHKQSAFDRYSAIRKYFLTSHHVTRSPSSLSPAFRALHNSKTRDHLSQYQTHIKICCRQFKISSQIHSDSSKKDHSPAEPLHNPHLENYPKFFRRLALLVPHLHRPNKDDLLKVTTSFWGRIRVRFKWFTIKSFRRWNADDISAFFTWFLMTQTVWILVGTCV